MTWDELLVEYRVLGGIAENIRLSEGRFGRGVFAIDPLKPVCLRTPEPLLAPVEAIELHDDQLRVDARAMHVRAAKFFELYEEHFGWGAGGREESWRAQQAWHELAPDLQNFIVTLGVIQSAKMRFDAPSGESCLRDFFSRRHFGRGGKLYIVPLIDLVNFSPAAPGYTTDGGFGVAGTFSDEVFVRYSLHDAIDLLLNYSFAALANFAYSLLITVDLPGGMKLSIERKTDDVVVAGGIAYPQAERRGNTLRLSHLKLGNIAAPDLPRGIFRKLLRGIAEEAQADLIFDSVLQFNRARFIELARHANRDSGAYAGLVGAAALNQLEALSACVGARAL